MIPQRTQDYLDNPVPSGSRNEELFNAACQLRDDGKDEESARSQLMHKACDVDGLPEKEASATIRSAFNSNKREALTERVVSFPAIKELSVEGMPAGEIQWLRHCFEPGDQLCVGSDVVHEDGRDKPVSAGTLCSLEYLLNQLRDGTEMEDIIWPNGKPESKGGAFVRINPMKNLGSRDEHVASYRHCLVEFDEGKLLDQMRWIEDSYLPCSCVIYSGGKSLHAWVKVDAVNIEEYRERVETVFNYFTDRGIVMDRKNRNPSRFSRLPGVARNGSHQVVLKVGIGVADYLEWSSEQQRSSSTWSVKDLLAKVTGPETLMGDRYLCRGGAMMLVGPTGIGKSVMTTALAVRMAVGADWFGINVPKPLRVMLIQAENDRLDTREMIEGAIEGLHFDLEQRAKYDPIIEKNLVIIHEDSSGGEDFIRLLRKEIERHQPDVVIVDPLLAYIGGDSCSQSVASAFCRRGLNPLLHRTGVACIIVHHTPKASKDSKFVYRNVTDHSYGGMGSSDFGNWARAVISITSTHQDYLFKLIFAKRGKRTGLVGKPSEILIKHSDTGLDWIKVNG